MLRRNAAIPALVLLVISSMGCDKDQATSTKVGSNPKIETIRDFTSGWKYLFTTIDVAVTYTGKEPLSDVKLIMQTNFEEGANPSYQKDWAYWNPNETKTINITRSGGKVDRIKIEGTATKAGKPVDFQASFNFTK